MTTSGRRFGIQACLLGGAVGDALGAPVEFLRWSEIKARFGDGGIRDYVPAYGRLGAITDDTQMTLFTAEGLLRAYHRWSTRGICHSPTVIWYAYQRWLVTQGGQSSREHFEADGWLFEQRELHAARAPGRTCLAALRAPQPESDIAENDSKGCGGVMRVAPCGLMFAHAAGGIGEAFDFGKECAALTHGHPTGYLTAGIFAALIHQVVRGESLATALDMAKPLLRKESGHEETLSAIESAELLAESNVTPDAQVIHTLGSGWVAEAALAIAVYCALVAKDFEHGVVLAVNHDGDSDSTGAMAGNLLGAMWGESAIPARWLEPLELREVIAQMADDLHDYTRPELGPDEDTADAERLWSRYPPG